MSAADWIDGARLSEVRGARLPWSAVRRRLAQASHLPPLGRLLLAGVVYHLLARLGVALGIPPDGIAVFWPPNAIMLCTFLNAPMAHWWAYVGVFLCAELVSDVPVFSAVEALGFGVVNCFEGMVSALILLRLFKDRFGLSTARELWHFVLVCIVAVPAVAALGGSAIYYFGGASESYLVLWRTWWFGDAVGLVAFAPLILVLLRKWQEGFGSLGGAYWIELFIALAALAGAAAVAFRIDWPLGAGYERVFYIYPILVWIALRGQILGAAAAGAFTACIVSLMAMIGEVPGEIAGRFDYVLFLQQFLAATNLSTLTLAVLAQEMATLNRKLGIELEQTRSREQILEAKERAERANEAKTTFLAHMSHELRTPLNAIIGFAGVIRNETFGPISNSRYREYIADIEESAQHLLSLISDVIDIARIEGGRLELSDDIVEPNAVIDHVFRMLRTAASKKSIVLCKLCAADLPRLRCDEVRLRQVLINLVGNAVKFSPALGRIEVYARHEEGALEFIVRDYGPGIPPASVASAFNRFQQFSSDPHVRAQGSGLGLYVSRMLMEAHGGQISLRSALGEGTTVTLAFPAERTIRS